MRNKYSVIILIALVLTTIGPNTGHTTPYQDLLTPDEVLLEVVYPRGRDLIARRLAVVYYVSKEHAKMPLGEVHAFAVYRPHQKAIRLDLKDSVIANVSHPMCGNITHFDLPLSNASVIRPTPNAFPQLILFGTGTGSGGFTNISIYTLSPVWLSGTRNTMMCAETQLEKECEDWAVKETAQSRVRYDRWMRAESIDDIKYVIRQVRGE